jgi:hypothetical protein
MNASSMGQGQKIAAVGGAVLFVSLFLAWFGSGDTALSGWEGQTTTDVYLLITAAVAIAGAVMAAGFPVPGVSWSGATALLGGVATILLVWLVVFDFPDGIDRGLGVILALIASAAIAYGGWTSAGRG